MNQTQYSEKVVPIQFFHEEDFSKDIPTNKIEAPEFNASDFLDELTSFNETGIEVYLGTDQIPGFTDTLTYLVINITDGYIYDDKDSIGAGDIYLKVWANGNFTRYPENGDIQVNSNNPITFNFVAFEGWTFNDSVKVEVWDADVTFDQSLGNVTYSTGSPASTTLEMKTGSGDANVTIQFIATGTKNTITAEELISGYRPFLYIDDETSGTEEPDNIYGRVAIGYDDKFAKDLWALQYFFFWEKESYGTPSIQLHKYDYEEFIIFLDPASVSLPVRYVYDQANNPLLPDHEFVIYEDSPTQTGQLTADIEFPEEFQPFLGTNITIPYTVYNRGDIYANGAYTDALLGTGGLKLTVDTFYHSFDTGEGSNEIGYNYTVEDFSDPVIKDWYSHMNESLHDTIHNIPIISYTTPKVSPFTFYVSNPFTKPYIINAWDNVMADLKAFEEAQNQKVIYEGGLKVKTTTGIDSVLTVKYPQTVDAGQSYTVNYSIDMDTDTLVLQIEYDFKLNITTNFWFLGGSLVLDHNGSYSFDIPTQVMQTGLKAVGVGLTKVAENIADNVNDVIDALYLEIDHVIISPTFFGTIVNASLSLHLWDMMVDLIPPIVGIVAPQYETFVDILFIIMDLIINHFDLRLEFLIDAGIVGALEVDNTIGGVDKTEIAFTESGVEVPVELTIDTDPAKTPLELVLKDIANALLFSVDWHLNGGLEYPFSKYISDWEFELGTFPSFSKDLPSDWIGANVTEVKAVMDVEGVVVPTTSTSSTTPTTTTSGPTTPVNGAGFELLIVGIAIIGIVIYRKKR